MKYPLRLVTLGILFSSVPFVVTPRQRRGIWGKEVASQEKKEKEFLPRISSIVSLRINIYREGSSEACHNGHGFKTKLLIECI
jgi:hypothetical protein